MTWNRNRHPEVLTGVSLLKIEDSKFFPEGFITVANARVIGKPELVGKTPKDIGFIQKCFEKIKLSDIESLPAIIEHCIQVDSYWKSIELKYWNEAGITYKIK